MSNNSQADQLLQEAIEYMNKVEIKGEMNMNNQLIGFIKIREARKLLKEEQGNEKRDNA